MIIKHPTITVKDPITKFSNRVWVATCDYCDQSAKKHGEDPGEAADMARKCGYQTVKVSHSGPLLWICYDCTHPYNKN